MNAIVKRPAIALGLVFVFLLITRLCHAGIVWVEEAYPAAAAIQILSGKMLYRDFWFDKPPLTPLLYLLWGAHAGVALRVAGALFLFACCALAFQLARSLWSPREGLIAAALLAFFITFDVPSAVMALAPDLAMLAPHFGAVYLASRRRPLASGVVAGVAMLVNPKAVFVLAACLLWCWREWLPLTIGFVLADGLGLATLALCGALDSYYRQVWVWGALYSRDTFIDQPLMEGLRRTAAWLGFHAAIVTGAAWYWIRERHSPDARRLALWALLALAGIVLGLRFFPRYYFLLLPAIVIAASRGLALAPRRVRIVAAALLLVPLIRFGPRYVLLAAGDRRWADLAMNRDSREAAGMLSRLSRPGDTLLVWGYRPDIFMYTRMPAGTPFLDSQPLTGVIADRHLTKSDVSAPEMAAGNRRRLTSYHPTFIVDGLGPYNPALAITHYPDLTQWLARYHEVARTSNSVIYRYGRNSP